MRLRPGSVESRYKRGNDLLLEISKKYNVDIQSIRSSARSAYLVKIRVEFCKRAFVLGIGQLITGKIIWCDPKTVAYHFSPTMQAKKKIRRLKYQAKLLMVNNDLRIA